MKKLLQTTDDYTWHRSATCAHVMSRWYYDFDSPLLGFAMSRTRYCDYCNQYELEEVTEDKWPNLDMGLI